MTTKEQLHSDLVNSGGPYAALDMPKNEWVQFKRLIDKADVEVRKGVDPKTAVIKVLSDS